MSKVQLYVYDLSRGMAKSMSLALTGKQIDGIWHTSVVVFGREIFFGQGVLESVPGKTHHGQPVQIIDCRTTEIDQDTFNEYLLSLQDMYSPEAYHLIEFNCNHFTADVVGFLTGGTIPAWISGLPTEFLSTPFGQAMRPQIDAMFKRTAPGEHRVQGSTYPTPPVSGNSTPSSNSLAAGLLSSLASQAQASGSGSGPGTPQSTSKPALIPVTSVSHFTSILSQHTAVIANFTNTPGCPPCRAIKPAYETIAEEYNSQYASRGVCFVDIELGVGEGRDLASRYGVSATPTFIFFKDGNKAEELKGADKRGLEAKVESFLEDCFPRHPHRKLYLPAIEAVPTKPIQSANAPNYTALIGKLEGNTGMNKEDVEYLKTSVVPILEKKGGKSEQESKQVYQRWTEITDRSFASLKPEETFPLIDLWRVGLLDPKITTLLTIALSPSSNTSEPLSAILELASSTLKASSSSTPKPFLLTVLRLLTNILATPLANMILATPSQTPKLHKILENLLSVTVDSLLHPDQSVRSAAAGVAVNLAGWRHRVSKEQSTGADEGSEHDWEVELVSAVIEAIGREADEDVAHRLLATLALSLFLSPAWESSLQGLLEVLGAKDTLEGKAKTYKKKEVRKLAEEIAGKVCV